MTLLFPKRKPRARMHPQDLPTPVGVNVTLTRREAELERGIDLDLAGCDVDHIRKHLPSQPVSANLRARRFAAVLDREAAFLADKTGTVEPPERWEVVDACRFAAEFIRDSLVIA
ncbi:MAG TPA: hypothetical protein VGU03_11020 [Frateuria sp.]|uniref:hypothetical protein n=1 Tax=Frateuria sp. TaxID=2211372 RepID=UPI002DE26452|nr:hypothetical protein [Frateuria sp.]